MAPRARAPCEERAKALPPLLLLTLLSAQLAAFSLDTVFAAITLQENMGRLQHVKPKEALNFVACNKLRRRLANEGHNFMFGPKTAASQHKVGEFRCSSHVGA